MDAPDFDSKSYLSLCLIKIGVALFDVTTLYFESRKKDNLRDFGFSKDCKFSEVQVVLSMVVSKEGRPLSYELFKGNTFEGNTMVSALTDMKNRYFIDKVTIVADRGMSSIGNLDAIKAAGFD